MPMSETSASLLERLGSRSDADAWQRLADIYTPLLRGWLRRYDVQDADADDLIQETLLYVAREVPSFRHNGHTGAFRSWLRTVLVFRLRKFWQTRQRGPAPAGGTDVLDRINELEDPASGLSRLWDRQHDEQLARALLQLIRPRFEEQTWQAFCRTVLEGEKPAVVAERLSMSPNAVCAARCRVLSHLRRAGSGLLE